MERWPVEIFFWQGKDKLAFDQYQIRSSRGVDLSSIILCDFLNLFIYNRKRMADFKKDEN